MLLMTATDGPVYDLKCFSCERICATIPKDEYVAYVNWLMQSNELTWCFDCDPLNADKVHPVFLDEKGNPLPLLV